MLDDNESAEFDTGQGSMGTANAQVPDGSVLLSDHTISRLCSAAE